MRESDKKALVRKGLRNVKAALRSMDTQVEKMERKLKALIARKTMPNSEEVQTMLSIWSAVKNWNPAVERAASDLVTILKDFQ